MDVKKIIGTQRGYNHIYFFTNQAPSSKKKKDCEKELKDESYQEVSELFINFKDELRLIVDLEKSEEE